MKTLEHRQCRGVQWSLPAGLTQCREELRLPGSCTTPSPRAQNKRLLLRWGTGTPFWCEGAGPGARWARSTPWSKVTNQTTRSRRSPWWSRRPGRSPAFPPESTDCGAEQTDTSSTTGSGWWASGWTWWPEWVLKGRSGGAAGGWSV